MNICDRCWATGKANAAQTEIVFPSTDTHYHLCNECEGKVREVLTPAPPKKRGRQKKQE